MNQIYMPAFASFFRFSYCICLLFCGLTINSYSQNLKNIEPKRNEPLVRQIQDLTKTEPVSGDYIVVYKKKSAAAARLSGVANVQDHEGRQRLMREEVTSTLRKHKLSEKKIAHVYDTALQGFAVSGLTDADALKLSKDDQVAYIKPDGRVRSISTSSPISPLLVTACPGLSLTINNVVNYNVQGGLFGGKSLVSGAAELVNDGTAPVSDGCETIPGSMTGKIAIIDAGCAPGTSSLHAQQAGAVGVVYISAASHASIISRGVDGAQVTIPVLSISAGDGAALKTALQAGPVNLTIDTRVPSLTPGSQCMPWGVARVGGGTRTVTGRAWVIDGGIDPTHPDLNVNTTLSTYFIGNDYLDESGHGTHVAGTIGALDNDFGVIGVAPGAEIIAVRVFDKTGSGPESALIAAMDYVTKRAAPADVVNMSLADLPSRATDDAALAMAGKCKVVIAAGNDAANTNFPSPGRINGANIYTISAIDIHDKQAYFSNFGSNIIDFAAPGVNVLSCFLNNTYAYLSGTSMAAPHVTGLFLLGDICATSRVINDGDAHAAGIATAFTATSNVDNDHDNYTACAGDKDDTDASIFPGAPELCDNKDNDGDGHIDEGTNCCPQGNPSVLYVKANAPGVNNGTSWNDAFISLQSALDVARQCTQIKQIWVAAGNYIPTVDLLGNAAPHDPRTKTFSLRNDLAIYGGFAGGENSLSLRNPGANQTFLNGDLQQDDDILNNAYNVILNMPLFDETIGNSAVLDGFIIQNGFADMSNSYIPYFYGGGMFNYESNPVINNCIFYSNAGVYGGGMANRASSPRILNTSFWNNYCNTSGGIHNMESSPTIVNSDFRRNNSFTGGAISNLSLSNLSITNSTFTANNGGTSGGSIVNAPNSTVTITNSILWGNSDEININPAGSITIRNSIVKGGWTGAGSNVLNADPRFTVPANFDAGILGNLNLLACSPALNAGDPATSAAVVGNTDRNGATRIFGGTIDMGAYEFQDAPFTISIAADPGLTVEHGGSVKLTASGGTTYLWSTTATTPAITVSPELTTTYSVTATTGPCSQVVEAKVIVTPLPVTLVSFSAKKLDNGSVQLTWVTANEVDNAYFELERSADARTAEVLTKVAGSSKSSTTQNYSFTDETPYSGTSYYRLKQVDLDGAVTTYRWFPIAIDRNYAAFPNPVRDNKFQVELNEPKNAVLQLFGTNGIPVKLQTIQRGSTILDVKLPHDLPQGVYILKVDEQGVSRQYRIVKH